MRTIHVAIAAWLLAGPAVAQERLSLRPYGPPADSKSGPALIDLSRSRDLENWRAVQQELLLRREGQPGTLEDNVATADLQRLDTAYSLRWFPRDRERAIYHGTCIGRTVDGFTICEVRPNIYVEAPPGSVAEGQRYRFETTRRAEFEFCPDGVLLVGGYVVMERID